MSLSRISCFTGRERAKWRMSGLQCGDVQCPAVLCPLCVIFYFLSCLVCHLSLTFSSSVTPTLEESEVHTVDKIRVGFARTMSLLTVKAYFVISPMFVTLDLYPGTGDSEYSLVLTSTKAR